MLECYRCGTSCLRQFLLSSPTDFETGNPSNYRPSTPNFPFSFFQSPIMIIESCQRRPFQADHRYCSLTKGQLQQMANETVGDTYINPLSVNHCTIHAQNGLLQRSDRWQLSQTNVDCLRALHFKNNYLLFLIFVISFAFLQSNKTKRNTYEMNVAQNQ